MKHESPLDPLLKQISNSLPVSTALKDRLSASTNIRYYPRQYTLMKAGELVNGMAIMLKGVAQATEKQAGSEESRWFATEGHFLTPVYKNGRDIVAQHDVTMLEDSFIAVIAYTDLQQIKQEYPGFDKAITEMQAKYQENIVFRDHLMKQPKITERMRALQVTYPGLDMLADQQQLISFLGMDQ